MGEEQERTADADFRAEYPKVLVVDDDYMNIEVIVSMLNSRGIKSNIALNGKQALSQIQ